MVRRMQRLTSYVNGAWSAGAGKAVPIHNPTTEAPLAEVAGGGWDAAAVLAHARQVGGPGLRALGFAGRAELLRRMAKAMHGARDQLIQLAIDNGGNTRGDAKRSEERR